MFTRNPELSAYQRLITALCIRGRAEDMLLSRLNKIGLTLSTASKQRLIEECGKNSNKKLTDYLEGSPLLKITGDNLDIFIKPSCQSVEKSNYDLHLFASNAISCRAATPDLNTSAPKDVGPLNSDIVRLTDTEKDQIRNSYIVLISRILSSMGQFKWMESIIPKHIHHPHKAAMAEKSQVFQLPIQHKNEAKYEDVLSILDDYEKLLQKAFRDAHGDIKMLEKYRVVTGGDQLTKVRFAGAINLRLMSPTSTGRLEHVQPVVCELWHLKQDYLEKCYKALYKKESMTEEGKMSYFRNVLKKNDVNGKVKGHFKTHSEFFKILTESIIREQALELFNMNDTSDDIFPAGIDKACRATKELAMRNIGNSILGMLGFLQAEMNTDDDKFNYCSNLCLRGLH
ncbi:uncharacterized protein LOC143083974 [Mytilus galloprovincialis]|uniref:uncharacterized protein LOC143083974 n=1 Tax=Mytilus galloprovincialis TaxID=29158 RepID=UPI003F7CA3CE